MTARRIPDFVTRAQLNASDPAIAAFVSANAGSGKTHVLVQRVIRLLLAGNDPARILCITFTNAAAATMQSRIFDTLAAWVRMDDAALDAALAALNEAPDAALRRRARQLFARALETPGGLKVQTIHALCTRLLQQFPFEAATAAHFTVLEERDAAALKDAALMEALQRAARAPDSALGRALTSLIGCAADQTIRAMVEDAIGAHRDFLGAWLATEGGASGETEALAALLSDALAIDRGESAAALQAELLGASLLPPAEWRATAEALAAGSDRDQQFGERLNAAAEAAPERRSAAYLAAFLTGKGDALRQAFITKAIRTAAPVLAQRIDDECARMAEWWRRYIAVEIRDRSAALVALAGAVLAAYRAAKARRGALDFDDLIARSVALLTNTSAAWVHYKLDRGVDHVLIDESQDTSPQQWEIVLGLISEFTAGEGARGTQRRTVFAVGDEKQSIFSFQGADVAQLEARRRQMERDYAPTPVPFKSLPLRFSFRSSAVILDAVDRVFGPAEIARSISARAEETIVHEALPDAAPGLVEVWDLVSADKPSEDAWAAPLNAETETSAVVKLAARVAAHIAGIASGGAWVGHDNRRRPASAGDVLVLVRKRGALFEAIIRALKSHGVPVAGADRLALTEHIAVRDLMALSDAILLEADDLALATALKSPLFGLDDDDLMALAPLRTGSLRAALAASTDPKHNAAAARLARWCEAAALRTPYGFFAWLLGAEGGRRAMMARLGAEVHDPLDEFLTCALDFDRREAPTLQGFLHWLRAAQTEIKRDMELQRAEVRVMTVHGAKGLEAPIVYLVDTTQRPQGGRAAPLLQLDAEDGQPSLLTVKINLKPEPDRVALTRQRRAAAEEDEYRRLLYVAMTRAAERLYVAGAAGRQAIPDSCWYRLIERTLEATGALQTIETAEGRVRRFAKHAPEDKGAAAPPARTPPVTVPDYARAKVAQPAPIARLRPSRDGSFAPALPAPRRGTLIHRLLQTLPSLPAAQRATAAQRWLARQGGLSAEMQAALAEDALRLIAHPAFGAVFGADSLAEVPIVARLRDAQGRTVLVNGQADRIAVLPDSVLVADFKTNRRPPATVPAPYIRQLALYRAALGEAWPGRLVRAAVIWTETPALVELSAEALDLALAATGERDGAP